MHPATRLLLLAMPLALASPAAAENKSGFAPLERAPARVEKTPAKAIEPSTAIPQRPIEVIGGDIYLVPPEKSGARGAGENEARAKPTPDELAEKQLEREKAAIKAEVDKLTAMPRTILLRAEGTSRDTVPVPTLGAISAVLQPPVGRFTLPIKAESGPFAALIAAHKQHQLALAPAEAQSTFSTVAQATQPIETVTAAPAPTRMAALDQSAEKTSFDPQLSGRKTEKSSELEVMALSTARPFGAVSRDAAKPVGMSALDSASPAPVASLTKAAPPAPVPDLLATP